MQSSFETSLTITLANVATLQLGGARLPANRRMISAVKLSRVSTVQRLADFGLAHLVPGIDVAGEGLLVVASGHGFGHKDFARRAVP